jgi:hypothetical protein
MINKHKTICAGIIGTMSTLLAEQWCIMQAEVETEDFVKKEVKSDCIFFFCVFLHTILYVAMTTSILC